MEEHLSSLPTLVKQYWPALLAIAVVALIVRGMFGRKRQPTPVMDPESLAIHQIKMNLGCNSQQARLLLQTYSGDANQAIMDVKTGRAVLPGEDLAGDLPQFAGQIKKIQGKTLTDHQEQTYTLAAETSGLLVVGILESDQRPNKEGLGDAARGRMHGQFFLSTEQGWKRFRIEASKLNYTHLGERLHNQAARNFHEVVGELTESAPRLVKDRSVESFLAERRAPIHTSLAAFEKVALDAFASLPAS